MKPKTLHQRRTESGLTMHDIAAMYGMSPMSIHRVERGQHVGAPLIVRYADALGISPVTAFRAWLAAHDQRHRIDRSK